MEAGSGFDPKELADHINLTRQDLNFNVQTDILLRKGLSLSSVLIPLEYDVGIAFYYDCDNARNRADDISNFEPIFKKFLAEVGFSKEAADSIEFQHDDDSGEVWYDSHKVMEELYSVIESKLGFDPNDPENAANKAKLIKSLLTIIKDPAYDETPPFVLSLLDSLERQGIKWPELAVIRSNISKD